MSFSGLVEGPFLWVSILFCIAAFALRMVSFVARYMKNKRPEPGAKPSPPVWAAIFPLNRALFKTPFYTLSRAAFHIGLLVVVIFFAGHVELWEMSSLEWSWPALPYAWADVLTAVLLALCAFFLVRRIFVSELRKSSSPGEWLVVWMVALPVLTGAMLAHGGGTSIGWIDDNLYTLHILFGEIMLIGAGFLMVGLKISPEKCVGCAACEINCPSGALQAEDTPSQRLITHTSQICLVCGLCRSWCPKQAVQLTHNFSLKALIGGYGRREVRQAKLANCSGCGESIAPEKQLEAVRKVIGANGRELCSDCLRGDRLKDIYPALRSEVNHVSGECR